tara:strand:- start:2354 stop:2935 length:582 start_codon:yes stop_codon:yes gene_type:complete
MIVGILDCATSGNIYSVKKAIDKLGYDCKIIKQIKNIDKLIIPGVGSFPQGSDSILPYKEKIIDFSKNGSILGICLGMQLLCKKGFEFKSCEGLGLIDGECVKVNTQMPLPHIGWNGVELIRKSKLFEGIEKEKFYFMHSYEVINYTECTALTTYEDHKFVSAIESDNIFGVQFHPEKSGSTGLKLFDNFLKL